MPRIYPVIHHLNPALTKSEAYKILSTHGVDGIFLISHYMDRVIDWQLVTLAEKIKQDFPTHHIGVNLLSISRPSAKMVTIASSNSGLDMVWFDNVPDLGISDIRLTIFAGVAFKHQVQEDDPVAVAEEMRLNGFVPTTSGEKTGVPPSVEKIRNLSVNGSRPLANASGMTPENVAAYAPYLSHIFVASGINREGDFHHVDETRLRAFIAAAN